MKKIIYTFILLVSFVGFSQFGIEAGYTSSKAKLSGGNASVTTDAVSGFGVGLLYGIEVSDMFKLETGVKFGFATVDGESSNSWGIPLTGKVYLGDGGFHLRPGVSYSSTMEDIDTSLVKKGAFSGSIGLGYDISEKFVIMTHYATQLSNSAGPDLGDGIKLKGSGFAVGLQFFF